MIKYIVGLVCLLISSLCHADYLSNGSMEFDTDWTAYGQTYLVLENSDKLLKETGDKVLKEPTDEADSAILVFVNVAPSCHAGAHCYVISLDSVGLNGGIAQFVTGITTGGWVYTAEAWVKGGNLVNGDFVLSLGEQTITSTPVSNGTWVKLTGKVTPTSETGLFVINVSGDNPSAGYYVDDFSLVFYGKPVFGGAMTGGMN